MRPNSAGRAKEPSGIQSSALLENTHSDAASDTASVVTARYNPRRRSAGRPTSTATRAPTGPAMTIDTNGSQPRSTVHHAPIAPPAPTKTIWPSDT